jgi:hypothetical protein
MFQCSSFVGYRFQMFARNSGPQFLVGDLQLYLNLQCVEKSGGNYILKNFFLNLTFYDFNDLILNNLILELFIHCVSIPRRMTIVFYLVP